jgi:hypothetical protein
MALVLKDRVQETTTTTGTGTLTLGGAVLGYQTFAAIGNANTTYYTISSAISSEWEVGLGTYTASGTTLSRDTVLASSNSGSLVVFSAGTKNVFCTYPSSRAAYVSASGPTDFATTTNTQFNSLGVGTPGSAVTGEIRATNNVTAYYSDDRLKTKLGNIQNALAKVKTLSGFYYEANQTAQDLGYEPIREVGVSAQQVQAVLPEVVVPAPIDDKYLTVRYEKIIPLLIEAIKELDDKLEALTKDRT